jgi:hypothetical protein
MKFPVFAGAAALLACSQQQCAAQVIADCGSFDPTQATPCTDTPAVGDLCTLASSSARIRPTQAPLGFMLRDCKVRVCVSARARIAKHATDDRPAKPFLTHAFSDPCLS